MTEDIKATLVVIGDFAKTKKPGKRAAASSAARIVALPDHAYGDPFRRGRKAVVVKSVVGKTLEDVADEIKSSSRRAMVKLEITGSIDDAYDEGVLHEIGEYDDLSGVGGMAGVRKWFARNDSDDYRSGTAGRLSEIALNAATVALEMAAADKPAGPHKAAMENIEATVLPEFNKLLRMVDMPTVTVGRGDWGEVHYRITADMSKVASKVATGY